MTVKTINYIHDLLANNEAAARSYYQNARAIVIALEDETPDEIDEIKIAEEDRKRAGDRWDEAIDALRAFEEKEWN